MNDTLLAAGPPPLTVQAADCSIDLIDFMAAIVRGVDLIDVTPAVRQAWRSHLASYYPMLNPADRYWFATAPYTLSAIRSGWPQFPEMHQNMYRQAWAASLPMLLQFIDPALQSAGPMQPAFGYPSSASTGSEFSGQFGSSQPPSDSMSSLIGQIHSKQHQAEEEALRDGGVELQQQVKLQNEATNMQMLSNMSQMRFQSMMAVAKNLKY